MMIRIYYKYLFVKIFTSLLVTSLTLVGIIWLSQSTRLISLIANSGFGLINFFELSFFLMASFLPIILPISLFVVTIYSYNKLLIDSEFVSLQSAGISDMKLFSPALTLSLLVMSFCYFISLYLAPIAHEKFEDKINYYHNNYASILLEEGVFNNNIKNITIYIDEKKPDGKLKGILVQDSRNPSHSITMLADTGEISIVNGITTIQLFNGSRQEIDKNNQLAIFYFDHLKYDLSLFNNQKIFRNKDIKEANILKLLNDKKFSSISPQEVKYEINMRLYWPIITFVLTCIALLAVNPSEYSRKGKNKRILKYSILAIIITCLYFISNSLSIRYNFLKLLPFIYLLTVSLFLLFRLTNQ